MLLASTAIDENFMPASQVNLPKPVTALGAEEESADAPTIGVELELFDELLPLP